MAPAVGGAPLLERADVSRTVGEPCRPTRGRPTATYGPGPHGGCPDPGNGHRRSPSISGPGVWLRRPGSWADGSREAALTPPRPALSCREAPGSPLLRVWGKILNM